MKISYAQLKYDMKMANEVAEFPQEIYKEVKLKLDIIDSLILKYYHKPCEKLKTDWEKFEDLENSRKWDFYMNRSKQSIFEISSYIKDSISFYG